MNESCHIYEWVMSHICMSHATHMDESCHTYEWVMSHVWMRRVTHMNESSHTNKCDTVVDASCHIHPWVVSHNLMSHVTRMNESCFTFIGLIRPRGKKEGHGDELTYSPMLTSIWWLRDESCHTYGWVMSHIWMSHVTYLNESCHTYGWVMAHIWMSHVTHMDESSQVTHMCELTCLPILTSIWRSCACVTWLVYTCSPIVTSIWWSGDESCHIYGWVMSHIWMSHVKSHICVPWIVHLY